MNVGDRVRHIERDDVGIGTLTAIYPNGNADAEFPGCTFSGVPLATFISLEIYNNRRIREDELRRQAAARRNSLLQEIRMRFHSDCLGVDSFYHTVCATLIPGEEYESEKLYYVKSCVANNTSAIKNGEKSIPDDEQAAAIGAVHGHVQVVARAGSGKTTTLVNRTLFLLKHCGVAPSEMLLLAFNRKAALEIRRKLLGLLNEEAEAAVAADIERRIREAPKSLSG
jgi:DNA helicase-4